VRKGIVVEAKPQALALSGDGLVEQAHKAEPSTVTGCTAKPISRRLNWSIATKTQ